MTNETLADLAYISAYALEIRKMLSEKVNLSNEISVYLDRIKELTEKLIRQHNKGR